MKGSLRLARTCLQRNHRYEKRNSAVPERLAEFLHSMLAKEPTERPTMAEVVAQMDAFLKPGVLPEPAAEQAMLRLRHCRKERTRPVPHLSHPRRGR